ncbi:TIR domain-containing protein [Lentzea sp. NPDC051838]|uniref:TIR domain-containing protein n=1 Tax=Lentzea sp. NPDC051838 TaxID=3154849 RepID=UPI0034455C24
MAEPEYDAFISYSRALDGRLAPMLQRGVQRFAKPWNRLRASRVFLDDVSLSANPGLWTSIEQALGRSRWLILMASPEAAASTWVNRELRWWLEHRSAQHVLVVLTSGEYCQSVPAPVRKALGEEPRWVDLRWLRSAEHVDDSNPRLRECVADIASAVREVPKDDLVGEHVRQHRRTLRLARGVAAALSLLMIGVLVAGLVAVVQRNSAVAQARTATARGLASAAVANLRTDLALSQVLAAEAYRVEANSQTRAALFQSLTASPQLDRYLPVGGEVTALASSANGKVAVAGTADGRVVRWDLASGKRSEQQVGARPVDAVATSANGAVIAAAGTGSALRWDVVSGATQQIDTPDELTDDLVAVSPSGRFTAFYSTVVDSIDDNGFTRGHRIVHDGQTGKRAEREEKTFPLFMMRLPNEDQLLEISYNDWVRRAPTSLDVVSTTRGNAAPANGFGVGLSANGDHFGFSTGGEIRLWRTTQQAFDFTTQDALLKDGRPNPSAVAIAGNGARTAVSDTGTIYVYDMSGPYTGERMRLEGDNETPFVEFLGDNDHLVSASRDRLAVWDLTRNTRVGSPLPTRVPLSCNACPPPYIAASKDDFAVSAGPDVALGSYTESAAAPSRFGPVVWNAAGDGLFVVTADEGIGETWQVRDGLHRTTRWKGDVLAEYVVAMGAARDDHRVVTVNELGDVQVFEGEELASARTITMNRRLDQQGWPPAGHLAAVRPDAAIAAVVTPDSVVLVDTVAGTRRDLPGGPAAAVTFTADSLVVQRAGTVEVWDGAGTSRRRVVQSDPSYLPGIAANPGTTLVTQLRRDHVLVVTDLVTGEPVGQVLVTDDRGRFGRVGMAFSGERAVVTAIPDTPLFRWDLSEENWVRTACATAGRDLTADEWRRYVGTEPPSNLTCG